MKKLVFILLSLFAVNAAIFAQEKTKADDKNAPQMIFKVTEHDFGTLKQGDDCSFNFVYKNMGKQDLVISNVSTSCGCTTPSYTKEPVKKKKEGTIAVKYDSNRIGAFTKTITITSNAKNSPVTLTIKGTIEQKQ